jgi:hypothetical protein
MNGKNVGTTDVTYQSPDSIYGSRNIRSRNDMQIFLTQNGFSMSILSKFDFRNVFCVCHQPEDTNRVYLECSLGLAGCRGWLHSECVGLGFLSDAEMEAMETVVCPLCTIYLEGSNQGNLLEGKKALQCITCHVPPSVTYINSFAIEEYKRPHEVFGMEKTEYTWNSAAQINLMTQPSLTVTKATTIKSIENNIKSPNIEDSKKIEMDSAKKKEYDEATIKRGVLRNLITICVSLILGLARMALTDRKIK